MSLSPTETTSEGQWQFHPHTLLELYRQQQWEALSETLLQLLHHFEQVTYLQLAPQQHYAINAFVKHFLYLFTQPDYILSDRHVPEFLKLNGTIANLVAISNFRTTDPWLRLLEQQPNNFVKLLTLYSPRNRRQYPIQQFFDLSPRLASLWYCYSFTHYAGLCANVHTKQRLKDLMAAFDNRLELLVEFHHMNFSATYIDGEGESLFKAKLNAKIRELVTQHITVRNQPNPRRIGVISGRWFPSSSPYRTLQPFVKALQETYEVVLYYFPRNGVTPDTNGFVAAYPLLLSNGQLDLSPLIENDLMLVYYPDIGMDPESILLSNLRLAPIQVMGYGHSVSTFGSEIDYFIGGAAVEPATAAQHYTEHLILLPGLGQSCIRPPYQPQYLPPTTHPLVINCSWHAQKVNPQLLQLLREILSQTQRPLLFRIFTGTAVATRNDFLPFVQDLQRFLPPRSFQIISYRPYAEYMALMERGAFALDPYPFGGDNTVVDSLIIGKPIVTYEGQRWYNRIGSALLKQVGLEELVATCDREYVEKALRLVEDDDYRQQLSQKLQQMDWDQLLFHGSEKKFFRQAIDYLIANHDALKQSSSREPILIAGNG
ncbi:O-linked N-acetylglucosamine transferase family protein [Thermosynechococcus sp. M55_K2018_012]|uniref:O-linked N-acetylglucosamine transferase family protein n=1 Tax=Thermosynechococcus sp. M55_K2018_012 TaxID=2747809 RepID=UPI0019F7B73B|nr:hypothetical protein [Thermosynechococcus sp. M55_K2018_012]HIK47915.1 hypothetical protein [Thermosynechococcus sp. M55_K2018_012]